MIAGRGALLVGSERRGTSAGARARTRPAGPYSCRVDDATALLLAAVQAAPRRYRMPPLPADAAAAAAAGPDAALAFAIEAARQAAAPLAELQPLFTRALAQLIAAALQADGGDAGFQALVLRARDAEVDEHVRLAAQEPADRRAIRIAADAFAHPGKVRALPAGALAEALARLHEAMAAQAWDATRRAVARLGALGPQGPLFDSWLAGLVAHPALARLERADVLRERDAVRRYRALCEQRGPLAGSEAAAAQGRASARVGGDAEDATVEAFRAIAQLLNAGGNGTAFRVVNTLRVPRGFPGAADKAKDEWDAAIVREPVDGEGAEIALLAEVKASPAAATPDFWRLLRGLQRLAHAGPGANHDFPAAGRSVRITAASLRRLQPAGDALPPHVIYCCSAPAEPQPALLSAATRGVLLAEAAAVAWALRWQDGAAPPDGLLAPVWEALATAPRLRSALHQYQSAQRVRAAMLQPGDLLQAVREAAESAGSPAMRK